MSLDTYERQSQTSKYGEKEAYLKMPAPKRTANMWQIRVPTAPMAIDVLKTLKIEDEESPPLLPFLVPLLMDVA